jgi:serine/threonine-protein kinase
MLLRPGSSGAGTTPRVSTEYERTVAQRLGIFAAVIAGVVSTVFVVLFVLIETLGWKTPPHADEAHVVQGALVALSLGVFAVSRSRRLSPGTVVLVGLVYEVAGAFLVALQSWLIGALIQDHLLNISWLCVWIVMFPLLVPATPRSNIVASFASATMAPLCFLFRVVSGKEPHPGAQKLFVSFFPNYMAAAMAIVPAVLLHRLGHSLHAAEKRLKELGSYQLVEMLGRGGMGEVWRAEHRMLAREAAVKIVHLEDETAEAREHMLRRFEVEARATASLHSPHTVSLYDFGISSEGTFYYVMELLYGLDLESLVSRFGPVPPARAVHIMKQACASLAEAHAAGMVHRDIKPANIYLCRLGLEHDWVKILDFGLVASAKGCTSCTKDGSKGRLTAANTIVGTPSFMAPEMAEGRPDIDGRADIYALGCVAYWLLTGTLVFDGPDKTPMKILMDHVGTPPEPPSKRLGRPLPAALEAVLLRCLEKDPRNRPPSASELARQLDACALEDAWDAERAHGWWKENLADLAAPVVDAHALSSTVTRQAVVA